MQGVTKMSILSIDTSNYVLGIALIDDSKVIGEYITNLKKNHSVRVMPAIQQLLEECDYTPKNLKKIVVAKGPGSYTGVRIGVTIAKILAWSLQIPLVGVSSLKVLAANGRHFPGFISPLFDARRGQLYTGLYKWDAGVLKEVIEDQNVKNEEWAKRLKELDEPVLFLGNDLPLHQDVLSEILGENYYSGIITEHNPRPAELALLGKDLPGENIHTFTPNYIRLAEAEAKWLGENNQG